ncbi:hypothetical protein B0O80DRAFT_502399 [Mortierella sp. GBAus27b]|nr:hypothetical protein B0O80DRAFT_502399 [Mortierella sp. GBAus27b]
MNAPTAAPVFSLFKVLREPTPLSDISKHRDRSTITLNEYRLLPHVYKVITTAPSSYRHRPRDHLKNWRTKKELDPTIASAIVDTVTETYKQGISNSSRTIANQLKEDHNFDLHSRTIRRNLHELNLHWGKEISWHMLHDSVANVRYRHQHLEERVINIWKQFGVARPIRPERPSIGKKCLKQDASRRSGANAEYTHPFGQDNGELIEGLEDPGF